jgi:hypothetical protein
MCPVQQNEEYPSQFGHLSNQGAGSGALVSPSRRKDTNGLVVTGETVDTGLNENETELAILVLAVALKVLADGDSLLDEEVKVLRDLGGEAYNGKVTLSALCLTKQRQKKFFSCQIDTFCV